MSWDKRTKYNLSLMNAVKIVLTGISVGLLFLTGAKGNVTPAASTTPLTKASTRVPITATPIPSINASATSLATAPTTQSTNGKDVEAVFTITNQAFDIGLLYRGSSIFRPLQSTVINHLNALFPTQIQSARVNQFRPGSIQVTVEFKILLTSANAVSTVRNLLNATIRSGVLGSLSVDKNSFIWRSQGDSCSVPIVSINNLGPPTTPVNRSTSYIVQTTVTLNCSLSRTSFVWTIRTLNVSRGNYVVSPESTVVARGTAEWMIKKRTLSYGLYMVEFRVSMIDFPGIYASDVKFLSIRKSALLARIAGGSHVTRGFNQTVSLDASPSQDPDVEPGDYSGMMFFWFCKKENETFQFPENPLVISTSGPTGKGGCFGTGSVRLNSTERVVYIITDQIAVNSSYHIQMFVVKGQGRFATFLQTIKVVRGDPPQITISCRINCASSVSTSSRIKLTTNCVTPLQTCRAQLTYVWTMQVSTVPSTWQPITDLQTKLLTLLSSPDIVIKDGVLLGGKKYRVTVKVSAAGITPAISSYEFNTNAPPTGGTCSVTPLIGKGLKTEFKFNCLNWDDDNDKPLTYQFYYMTERGLTSVVYYGANRKAESKLPVGKKSEEYIIDFTFLIIDSMSSATKLEVKIQVTPALSQSEKETNELLSDTITDVDGLLKAGNVNQAAQLANAVLDTITNTPAENLKPEEKTKLRNSVVQQMLAQFKVDNLQTLTQLTSVIGRATANPVEVSFKTQNQSVEALKRMATLFQRKSNEGDVLDDRLIEAGGENMVLSIGNIMNSASQKARITGNKQRGNMEKQSETATITTRRLVDKVGGTLLSRKVIGEQPTVVRTASLSMVLGRQTPNDIGGTKLEEAGAGFTLPSDDVLKDKIKSLKLVDTQMVLTAFNPFTWHPTASSVNSDVVTTLDLKDVNGNTLSVHGLTKNIEITIPGRKPAPNITTDKQLLFLKPDQMRYHKMVIDHEGTAIELKVDSLHQVPIRLFIKHQARPSLSNYDYKAAIPDLPFCINGTTDQACRKGDTLVFLSADLLKKKGTYFIGLLFDKIKPTTHARKKRSCFGHGRQKRSCVEPKDPPHPGNRTIIPVYDPNTDVNYTMSTQQYGCLYWDSKKWINTGCKVGSNSSAHALKCLCTHLTSFGGNLFVAPNPIDFDVVRLEFTRLGESNNVAVLTTIILFLFLYIIIAVIAWRADRRDRKMFGPPISINTSNAAGFQYEMTVVTGVWRNCGTTANVGIVIHGSEAVSEPIVLSRNMRPSRITLASGNADSFIISLPNTLGSIEYLTVWHDNSGVSPSWFLNQIDIKDLNNERVSNFVYGDWIALERGDGSINKILLPTSPMEMKTFKYSFSYRTSKKFTEDHLWLSVLTKPPHNNFTRLQRATCCMCVLFSAMVSNAMFYNLNKTSEPTIQVGPFKFSWRQVIVGIQSGLISLPVGLACVALFQYSRPKENPDTKNDDNDGKKTCSCCPCYSHGHEIYDIGEAEKGCTHRPSAIDIPPLMYNINLKGSANDENTAHNNRIANEIIYGDDNKITDSSFSMTPTQTRNENASKGTFQDVSGLDNEGLDFRGENLHKEHVATEPVPTNDVNRDPEKRHSVKKPVVTRRMTREKKGLQEKNLETFFSHNDHNEKKLPLPHFCIYIAWFLCIVTVAVSGSFTVIYSLQWGKEISDQWLTSILVSFTEDLFVIQPIKILLVAILMSCFFRQGTLKDVVPETNATIKRTENNEESTTNDIHISIPEESELAKAKEYRTKEKKMFSFGRNLLIYCIFLLLLSIISYGNRSYHGYQMSKNVKDIFKNFRTSKVSTDAKYWDWMVGQFGSGIYGGRWYNGAIEPKEEYIGNLKSLMIGMPRLRQLRIKNGSCPISEEVSSFTSECHDTYSFDEEETNRLNLPGWKPLPDNIQWTNLTKLCPRPWRYSTAEQLGFFSSWGYFHVYSGGGYVADLGYNNKTSNSVLTSLRMNKWIDRRTRTVLLEFAIFNPGTNYMGTVTFYYEILPTMFGSTFQRIETLALYPTQSGAYEFFLVCKFLFIILVIFYLVREGRKIYKIKSHYFKRFWNWVEILQISAALAIVICYIGKQKMLLDTIMKQKQNPYITINFQRALAWKEAENVAISISVFFATIKLLNMMRFNPHIIILLSSLKTSKETIIPYSIILFVIMLSYAQVGMLAFGSTAFEFSTVQEALYSVMLMSLGAKIRLPELIRDHRIVGPVFGFSYKLLMVFIFINFFVAILNDSFGDAQSNTDRTSTEFEMADFILDRLKEIFSLKTKNVDRNLESQENSEAMDVGNSKDGNGYHVRGNDNYVPSDNRNDDHSGDAINNGDEFSSRILVTSDSVDDIKDDISQSNFGNDDVNPKDIANLEYSYDIIKSRDSPCRNIVTTLASCSNIRPSTRAINVSILEEGESEKPRTVSCGSEVEISPTDKETQIMESIKYDPVTKSGDSPCSNIVTTSASCNNITPSTKAIVVSLLEEGESEKPRTVSCGSEVETTPTDKETQSMESHKYDSVTSDLMLLNEKESELCILTSKLEEDVAEEEFQLFHLFCLLLKHPNSKQLK